MIQDMSENRQRLTKVCSRAHADAYLLSGWTIKQEFRIAGEELPHEYLLEWPLDADPPTIVHPVNSAEGDCKPEVAVAESTQTLSGIVADLESAWAQWSTGLQTMDARTTSLLRAAFEAGWEGGKNSQV
jgi:hypothetical protein